MSSQNTIQFQKKKDLFSLFLWNFRSSFHGRGVEFHDFREYSENDDAKYIDWATSSREQNIIMRRYREEKRGDVICAVDVSENLYSWWEKRVGVLQDLIEIIWLSTQKIGENFSGYIFAPWSTQIFEKKDKMSYKKMQKSIPIRIDSWNSELPLLLQKHIARSFLFLITDKEHIDFTLYKQLAQKHDLICIQVSTHFENTLEKDGLAILEDTSSNIYIDLSDKEKISTYQIKRQEKIWNRMLQAEKNKFSFINIDEQSNVFLELLYLMKRRQWKK